MFTNLFFLTSKATDDAAERATSFSWNASYARFLTDRLAVGPLFGIFKDPHVDATGYAGGLVRYHFGDRSSRFIPFAELNASRTLNDPFANFSDIQLMGGVVIPMGRSGGRFRVATYYYRAFYDEDRTGYDSYKSFGLTWGAGLLF